MSSTEEKIEQLTSRLEAVELLGLPNRMARIEADNTKLIGLFDRVQNRIRHGPYRLRNSEIGQNVQKMSVCSFLVVFGYTLNGHMKMSKKCPGDVLGKARESQTWPKKAGKVPQKGFKKVLKGF